MITVDAFYQLYELHCQGRKVLEDGEVELSEVQNTCSTFVPRKNNKKAGLERLELSFSKKNKWEDD